MDSKEIFWESFSILRYVCEKAFQSNPNELALHLSYFIPKIVRYIEV